MARPKGSKNKKGAYVGTPEHSSWRAMIGRCVYPKNEHYSYYGGRGIRVCSRWMKFPKFLEDMGEKPTPGHTIERLDADGDYEPNNCVWATKTQNSRNKRNTYFLTVGGQRKSVKEWAELVGINYETLYFRLTHGWSVKDALKAVRGMTGPVIPGRKFSGRKLVRTRD